MVVGDLNFVWTSICPDETYAILVVNANAVLPSSIPAQSFEVIAGWNTKVVDGCGGIQLVQLSPCHAPNRLRTRTSGVSSVPAVKDIFGACIVERYDHDDMIARRSCYQQLYQNDGGLVVYS